MPKLIVCPEATSKTIAKCWSVVADNAASGDWAKAIALADKLTPAIISAIVAFLILHINRRRERRKLTLDLYNEFFSEDFSKFRYNAERYFDRHPCVDWKITDPFKVDDPDGTREGYAAIARFFTRLSTLYRMEEIDRKFAVNLFSWVAGYWNGFVFESMTERQTMSTREALRHIFGELERRSKAKNDGSESEYRRGLESGHKRRHNLQASCSELASPT